MNNPPGNNLSAENLYGVVTLLAFAMLLPVALVGEGLGLSGKWQLALENPNAGNSTALSLRILLSGLFHYLNNEVMYLALSNVHPITLAVGNTFKRVFIIVASLVVFRNPITTQGIIGSIIGVAGVLIYALTKQYYERQELK
mmetsp:Transcript_2911/g.4289  ORF Transcript_2911/g.4289 Transcript_2911/m.4289 type:complete len:142 (-) Transcript_2911:21-446(-)